MRSPLIRNFSIIAHIDHGKSTLADRLLEYTGAISPREFRDQVLDSLPMERERGITIKAHTVRFRYTAKDGQPYLLNLIDTPGHVDFNYEVSRALAACEGVLLVVDASQGVEAQTLANAQLAEAHHLMMVPVINKIDLATANVLAVKRQLEEAVGLDADDALLTSAKDGTGTVDVLEAVVSRIPAPIGDVDAPLKALIFDSWYDPYQGIIILVRLVDGRVTAGQTIQMMSSGRTFVVQDVGVLTPPLQSTADLSAGEVGYVVAGIKRIGDTKIGDTITDAARPTSHPLPGYRDVKPMVFCGLYAVEGQQPEGLREALEKLRLNDTAFTFEPETSLALGFGFRCGFLGLLHMEIARERLEREYGLSLLTTTPTVVYRVTTRKGAVLRIENPALLPPPQEIERFEEPIVLITIVCPQEYVGTILQLCQERRGVQRELKYLETTRVVLRYEIPMNELIQNFYDRLKTLSRGYASLDYEFLEHRLADLVRVDLLINGETVDALSFIAPRERAIMRGRQIAERLRTVIPRQLFEIAIQAAIGGRIVARETVRALRKNVTAKCYGGDITRKRKLWEKQREGKKRMKQVGRVEIPQEAFLAVLTMES